MFPNGYNFNMPFPPLYGNFGMGINPSVGLSSGLRNGLGYTSKTGGLFSKITGLRGFNWQGLLSNASKTLGVINQAIPIVKQVGPMYNNMKSMLKVASLFKDETDPLPKRKENKNSNNISINKMTNSNNNNINTSAGNEKEKTIITNNYSNTPNFFI